MNFPRPLSPRFSLSLALARGLSRPLPTVFAATLPLMAAPVLAAPANGVQAWTSGSQTYLRARPAQTTPIVAKVAKHTPLFVWGKFNGWYRVETHDHVFGWVHYELINSPELGKVKELSHARAIKASERNGNQTMYGKPGQLAKYFKKHGAPGAVSGLREMGVKVSFGPRAQAKPQAKPVAAKPAPKPLARPVAAKPAPRPKAQTVAARVAPKPAAKVASKPVIVSAPPARKPVIVSAPPARKAAPKAVIAPRAQAFKPSAPTAIRAAAPRIWTPTAPRTTHSAAMMAPRPVVRAVTAPVVQVPVAPVAAPVKLLPAPPQKLAAPARVMAPVAKPAPARRASARQIARNKRRQQLRAKMGLTETAPPANSAATPPLPIQDIAPVAPEELMKARRAYLDARKKKFGQAPAPAKENAAPAAQDSASPDAMGGPKVTPSSFTRNQTGFDAQGWAPFNRQGWNTNLGDFALSGVHFADWSADRAPAFRLVVQEPDAEMDAGVSEPDEAKLGDWFKLPTLNWPAKDKNQAAPKIETLDNAKKKPPVAAPSRGGSPRDRYKNQASDFRQNMANQALTYRGMPYIRGASSPSRGFDCSGLVYFLLRQRGYNPPRTAAGFASYGTSVARGQWKAGDLLLFSNTYKRGISHIGIYLGNNNFVHAASTQRGVRVDSMNTKYFAAKYWGARRVPAK